MLRLAVLVSGGGTNLQALLDKMDKGELPGVNIEVVISSRKQAYALERAKAYGIKTAVIRKKDYDNPDLFAEDFLQLLIDYQVDLIVLAGFLTILPINVVRHYRNKIINIHPSLIPAFCGMGYYGLRVHEEVLSHGVKLTGATVHFVDEGTDTGPIILQKAVPVFFDDTPEILQKRVMEKAEWVILPEAVRLISENRVQVIDNKVKIL